MHTNAYESAMYVIQGQFVFVHVHVHGMSIFVCETFSLHMSMCGVVCYRFPDPYLQAFCACACGLLN